ncbi:hypothetical protein BST61_g5785 [Cercospora zeina]
MKATRTSCDPRKKNDREVEAARPKDVNDVLIQMVHIAENLKRRGHTVKSWADVRLPIRDSGLHESPGIARIEAKLVVKQAEVFAEMASEDNKGRFLSRKSLVWEEDVESAKEVLKLPSSRLPKNGQFVEMLAANVKRIRRRNNRTGWPQVMRAFIEDFEEHATAWERARRESPHGLLQYQTGRKLEKWIEEDRELEERHDNTYIGEAIADGGHW